MTNVRQPNATGREGLALERLLLALVLSRQDFP